ncbi:ABC-type transport system involved in multi-copper enzyme maturation, permease component [Niallia circulans]|uniref:ABC transporter permease n=1 Tax=Niallia circulans TaxID=1397 RepID=UPI00077CA89D|nr:ABC transporter permease [Niallia circulans]MDR4315624.1 ABC transporter permease [Niallia circulans]MED3837130.1 ABC transporter permease [Niallia circulans]MED4244200.1 ABC transporter permease [Niallia circulans]MED4249066.1 ABC transporter permease [Niallia circulans]QKH61051.1 ABC transporter permease [Niallia circulans]
MKAYFMNPVLNKELKLRFRSGKTFVGILFYLLALTLLMVALMYVLRTSSPNGFFKPQESRLMFMFLAFVQLGLVLFITPGLTGGVISSERERQTLSILLTTTQSSFTIILGKLLSSISYLVLLILASLPIYSFVFLYGGISPTQLTQVFFFSLFTMLVIGSFGVLFSTLIRKTIVSMVTTYSVALFIVAGTAVISLILFQIANIHASATPAKVPSVYFSAMFNPGIVLADIFEPTVSEQIKELTGIKFPIWSAHLITYCIVIALSLTISVRNLRANMKKGS